MTTVITAVVSVEGMVLGSLCMADFCHAEQSKK